MNPSQSNSSLPGKLNPSSASFSPPPQQQSTQTIQPGPDFVARRSGSTSSQNFNLASARNNQVQKKKHKKTRRPGLGSSTQEADDVYAEASLMRNSTGRRGQTSITHLMNITLPPRPQPQFHTPRPGGNGSRGYARSGIGSGYHAEDKARYIHANYRFIVHPNPPPPTTAKNEVVSYRPQALDPDVPLDWNHVLQILVSSESQSSSCPICLSHPVAPRMAKCGHIFCLPCLIRYMHVDDSDPKDSKSGTAPPKRPKYKKCPLCWDSIYMSDTRPVRWFTGQENPAPREGEDVILRLVMRYPGSTLALPREDAEALGHLDDIPWWFAPEVTDYARIMKGTEEYMVEQYDKEIESLREQEKEDELMFGDETTWTRKAVNAVKDAKEKTAGIGNAPEQRVKKGKAPALVETKHADDVKIIDESPATTWTKIHDGSLPPSTPTISKPDEAELAASPKKQILEDSLGSLSITAKDSAPSSSTITAPPTTFAHPKQPPPHAHTHAPYYFYQSLPHYYLAPLDIRILKAAFGDFSQLPSTLLPRVEHVSTGHLVDDDLRKRTKYLAHLPYGGEVSFLECNWTDVVPDDILQQFNKETQSRRAKRNEKENREEKARVRAEKLEDEERWGRRRKETFAGEIEEERFGADDFVPLPTNNHEGTEGRSPPYATDSRPGFGSLSDAGGEGAAEVRRQQSVWGTTVLAAQEVGFREVGDENDGWLLDWEKELKMENEQLAAAQAASLADDAGAGLSSAGPAGAGNKDSGGIGSGQGKKKKKQKITLMSTTARRAA